MWFHNRGYLLFVRLTEGLVVELPVLIGLSGYARSGKDSTAAVLANQGYSRVAFADALRSALYALNPIIVIDADGQKFRVVDLVRRLGWDGAKVRYPEIRALLQRLGTDVGREQWGESFWVDQAMARVDGPTVFTDVRFPTEAQAILDDGGQVWRINRKGTGPVNDHPSETALDGWDFDRVIANDSSLEALKSIALGEPV